jgi:hypothetical protein
MSYAAKRNIGRFYVRAFRKGITICDTSKQHSGGLKLVPEFKRKEDNK